MARAVFQVKSAPPSSEALNDARIKRNQERSLPLTEKTYALISCLPYDKPKQRTELICREDVHDKITRCEVKNAETPDVSWTLLGLISRNVVEFTIACHVPRSEENIPFRTGYYKKTSEHCEFFSLVSYAPIVDSKPTDMATVYITMKKCVEMCCKAEQQYSVQTFDLQLYAITQQIKWSRPLEFQNHIIRLGGFHTLSCFITSIGKLWGDGGLSDLLVDSGAYATCTVEHILSGKQFNRAVRGLTLTYEVVMSLWLASFFDWCRTTERLTDIPDLFWDALLRCHETFTGDISS
jgi:hypothetical protein